jgi:hypothetical protein
MPPYYKKEEVIFDGKRYRKYNNYLNAGGGYAVSSIRNPVQRVVGIDFHFHIKREYFQIGINMSGEEFLSNNNLQGHLGYGLRFENRKTNLAFFAGPTVFTGVESLATDSFGISQPNFYDGIGVYISGQAIKKFTYDIGFGVDVFAEFSRKQSMAGFKFILFFSGAYRGPKKMINPNVRPLEEKK